MPANIGALLGITGTEDGPPITSEPGSPGNPVNLDTWTPPAGWKPYAPLIAMGVVGLLFGAVYAVTSAHKAVA
jgi:hypothetical protein